MADARIVAKIKYSTSRAAVAEPSIFEEDPWGSGKRRFRLSRI